MIANLLQAPYSSQLFSKLTKKVISAVIADVILPLFSSAFSSTKEINENSLFLVLADYQISSEFKSDSPSFY